MEAAMVTTEQEKGEGMGTASQTGKAGEGVAGVSASGILLICVAVSVVCGGFSGFAAGWLYRDGATSVRHERQIAVADVGDIVAAKKKAIIEKYKTKDDTLTVKEEMQKEITEFVRQLNAALAAGGPDRIVLSRDAVLSGGRDITEEVSREINGR